MNLMDSSCFNSGPGAFLRDVGDGRWPKTERIPMELLIINFNLKGITETDYATVCDQIAPAFAVVPGLATKVWLADSRGGVYGGVYTFETSETLEAFLASDLFAQVGAMKELSGISVRRFGVLAAPTAVTRGLVGASA